ncbi:MAG: chorismate lyase [Gammaproteobacteria bacterium]|nr:chorismate lyase [Gammaproteobacteria bacterium]
MSSAPSPAELLVSTDSLTACLRRLCRELTVELLWQGESELSADERQWLGAGERGWVREVCLRGDGQPWLLARSVAPLEAVQLVAGLRQLGEVPLGDWLFGAQGARRTRLAQLPAAVAMPALVPAPVNLWGRRSLFVDERGESLLVSEWLLAAYPGARQELP